MEKKLFDPLVRTYLIQFNSAHVFTDMAELKRQYDLPTISPGTARVEMTIADLQRHGVSFEIPSDPIADRETLRR